MLTFAKTWRLEFAEQLLYGRKDSAFIQYEMFNNIRLKPQQAVQRFYFNPYTHGFYYIRQISQMW